ncbi:Uncharacterised protein [Mycobacteroides abscessus subsp. abscessus]|nr:Uncharacterised protein [Mycobacteroides abscessus subsp. abscessus]SKU99203.1 Uncharacterised protein [Mycobacteroides abscessus subsp. abscessus]
METAAEVSCAAAGTGSSAVNARTQVSGEKPTGRTTTSSLATGSRRSSASPARVASSDSMPAEAARSASDSNQSLPCPPNATAYGSPDSRRSISAGPALGPGSTAPLASGSSELVTLSYSLIVTSPPTRLSVSRESSRTRVVVSVDRGRVVARSSAPSPQGPDLRVS